MALRKNTASQKWLVFAFDRTDNTPKTGDAAQITAKIRKDSGSATATDDTNPTEVEDGYYEFDLTQAETNANVLDLLPESSTSDIQVIAHPARDFTVATSTTTGRPEVDVYSVSDDATAANNLELDYDGTGYTKTNSTVGTVTVNTDRISAADIRTAVGLASANLDTQLGDVPTVAEFNARTIVSASYALEASLLDAAAVRSAVGLASANLDSQLADLPTVAEIEARTLVAANYSDATAANQAAIIGYVDTEIAAVITHLTDIKGATWDSGTDTLEAIRNRGDAAWISAVGFSTHAATDVWAAGERTLTAATNITSNGSTIDQTKIANLDAAVSSRLAPTTAARTLDVTAGGCTGVDWDNVESPTTTVGLTGTTVGTLNAVATDAITADALKADAVAELATGLLDLAGAIDGKTLRQAMRYIAAVAAGEITTAGESVETFLGLDGVTERVAVTVDGDGNRSDVAYDP